MATPKVKVANFSKLPREVALKVFSYLSPRDLLRATQASRQWHLLCEDDMLWQRKCHEAGINEVKEQQTRHNSDSGVPCSPWKSALMRQLRIEWNWCYSKVSPKVLFRSHNNDNGITCLEMCGDHFVTGAGGTVLKVWSVITGECLRTLVGHIHPVLCVQITNTTVISGSSDGGLKVWNVETGECLHTLIGHTSYIKCLALDGGKVVSGSWDTTLLLWDIDSGECLHTLTGHTGGVTHVEYNTKYVVSWARDFLVKVWDPLTGQCLHTLQGDSFSFQFNGTHIASACYRSTIRVWDVEAEEWRHTLEGINLNYVRDMLLHATPLVQTQIQENLLHAAPLIPLHLQDNFLVTFAVSVQVWDITSGKLLYTLQEHNRAKAMNCSLVSGKFLITGSSDGKVKLWDLTSGLFIRDLLTLDNPNRVFWKFRCSPTKLVCSFHYRYRRFFRERHVTRVCLLNFDVEELP